MNRFAFIFAALLMAFAPVPARAAEIKYTVVPGFFEKDPDGKQLGPCHGAALVDKAGNFYITTDTPRGIVVFSPDGKFLKTTGTNFVHGAEIREENGVEYIYAARPNFSQCLKLTLDGKVVWDLEYPDEADLPKGKAGFHPCALTVGPDGSIYVADGYGSNFILKFDKDRKFVKKFGGPGKDEGKFNTCHGIALDTRQDKPLLLVCNRNNNRVEYWDLDGNFVKVIQKDLRMPAAVHIRGNWAVFPELQGRATLLDKEGNIVAQPGDNPNNKQWAQFGLPKDQWVEGNINSGHGACLDKDGNIIVSEWTQFGRVHKFAKSK